MQAQSVTLDFLKPVGTVVDLSDKFNARVGDSMTPFNLFVTEGGKPRALNGLHPELEAAVGDGELKDGKVVMSDNAKGIHWVGSADNVTGYNRLTLTFPAEVFPQSGFCYGHLILANDAGTRESSVDIWFKVLDGLAIMGLAADYYDSAIELELKKLKEANSQAAQRLSEMKARPQAFANLDDLKAKYPVGNSNLNVTVDDGHLWIWLNGGWRDCGRFQAAGIDDSEKEKMLSKNSDNLIANSDFDGFDLWEISDQTDYEVQTYDAINNSHILYFIGKSGGAYISSKERKISNQSSASWGVLIRGKDISSNNLVSVSLEFKDENHTKISSSAVQLDESYNTDSFRAIKLENVTIPANTAYIDLTVFQSGTSQVWVMRPQANFGSVLYPYSFSDIENLFAKSYMSSSDNLIINSDFANQNLQFWNVGGNPQPAYGFDVANSLNNSNILHFTGNANAASYIASDNYGVGLHTVISAGVLIRGNNINSTDHIASVSLEFHDNLGNKLTSQAVQLDEDYNDSEFHFVKIEGATVPDGAVTVDLSFFQTSDSELWIARPQINFGATLIPYSLEDLLSNGKQSSANSDSGLPKFFIQCNDAIADKKTKASFSFEDQDRTVSGYMQISIQGASSRQYPKKNYKIKLFKDNELKNKLSFKPKSSWHENSSFNLKANWIDATQARNLVNSELFASATAITPIADDNVREAITSTQNLGQMEGFPVSVYLNGQYHGLYTFNTKKDADVYGMDSSNASHEAITIENNGAQAKLRDKTATVDMLNFATVVHDTPSDELKRNFTAFLNFLNTSSDSDFKSQIGNYIDVKSAINVYLYQALAEVWDGSTKSYIFLTYNGGKYFYLVDYDLDSSWGLWWDGSKVATDAVFDFTHPDQASFLTQENNNLLFQRIYQNFKPEIKSQYQKLRQSVWSNVSIMKQFKEFINSIPEAAYNHDYKVWPDIPSRKITSYSQIQNDIIRRGNQMDAWISQLA